MRRREILYNKKAIGNVAKQFKICIMFIERNGNMEYTKLGKTDIEISKLCVGCMSFGKAGTMHDWTLDENQTEDIVKHALDLGINFFDTANGYSAGTSEEYLGRAIKNNVARDRVVIASKVYFNEGRLSRNAIMREIDGSLKRLGTDYLDLYIILNIILCTSNFESILFK